MSSVKRDPIRTALDQIARLGDVAFRARPQLTLLGQRVQVVEDRPVTGRQPGVVRDVGAVVEPVAVAHEVAHDIAAEGERVHDVIELGGVRQPHGVPQFMNMGRLYFPHVYQPTRTPL